MRVKILTGLFIVAVLVFGTGITYSYFSSAAETTTDQKIAKFVFDAQKTDKLELPLVNLNPGDTKEYNFSISNTASENVSDTTISYILSMKTLHIMPLDISLVQVLDDKTEKEIFKCDTPEFSRNDDNELICNSDEIDMEYSDTVVHNYKIKVSFPDTYNTTNYSDLVDYIDLSISSYQKTE